MVLIMTKMRLGSSVLSAASPSISMTGLLKRPQIGRCVLSVKSIYMRTWNNEDLV